MAGLLLALPAAVARAEQPGDHPVGSRIVLGVGAGRALGDLQGSSAHGTSKRGSTAYFGTFVRYDHRLIDWLSVAATGGYFWWDSTAAADAGYVHRRVDLGLAPSFRPIALPNLGILKGEIYVSMPIGVSIPIVHGPPRRAFDERLEGRTGWYSGCVLGGALISRYWGVFIEAGYLRHASSVQSTITPHDTSLAPVIERIEYVDHQLLLTTGGLLPF